MSDFISTETAKVRRERITVAIAQGILSGPYFTNGHCDGQGDERDIANAAVRIADAIIARLEAQP
jgi:hypothetical protein